MDLNQAFIILQKSGGSHAAKIIINKLSQTKNSSSLAFRFAVWRAAQQLRRGVPVAKIINEKWFYGLPFYTNRHTLDPRPDTETMVEAVLKAKGKRQKANGIRILDLGTGTGCLICSIIKNLDGASGVGIDKSCGALRVAQKNVKDLGLADRIKIIRGDFTSNLKLHPSSFDIIISNPPYIAPGDARVDAGALHDPKIALYSGHDGLDAYRAIAKNARAWLNTGGRIFLEIGAGQGNDVRKIFTDYGWTFAESYKDLGNTERVLEFI